MYQLVWDFWSLSMLHVHHINSHGNRGRILFICSSSFTLLLSVEQAYIKSTWSADKTIQTDLNREVIVKIDKWEHNILLNLSSSNDFLFLFNTLKTETRVTLSRLRRRKSETLRVNYITNKDVRFGSEFTFEFLRFCFISIEEAVSLVFDLCFWSKGWWLAHGMSREGSLCRILSLMSGLILINLLICMFLGE